MRHWELKLRVIHGILLAVNIFILFSLYCAVLLCSIALAEQRGARDNTKSSIILYSLRSKEVGDWQNTCSSRRSQISSLTFMVMARSRYVLFFSLRWYNFQGQINKKKREEKRKK